MPADDGLTCADEALNLTTAKLIKGLFLVALAAALVPAWAAEPSAESKAFSMMRAKRYDLAIPFFNQAISQNKTPLLLKSRGTCYQETGKLDKAITDFDAAVKMDPKDHYIYTQRAYCYIKAKQWRKAIADLDVAIARGDESAYINRALAYERLGDHSKSIQDRQHILDAKMETVAKEARLLDYKGDQAAAGKTISEAIAMNPTASLGYETRGRLHLRHSEFPQAIQDLSKALNIGGSKDKFVYADRAEALFMMRRYKECIADCTEAIKLGYYNGPYQTRSQAYLELGQTNRSIEDLTTAIAKLSKTISKPSMPPPVDEPTSTESKNPLAKCYLDRAKIYDQTKQNKQAMSDFAKASELEPTALKPAWREAQFLEKIGEIQAATNAYSNIINRFPKMAEPFRRRGDIYLKAGHPEKAVADYTKAIANMDIDAGPSYYARAQAYEKLGKPELAKKDRESAKKLGFTR
jgi:tetratricopeptide (TPR) repeat protein